METNNTISYAPVVQVRGESGWHRNGLRFATREAALEWVQALSFRWTLLVTAFDVEETTDPVNRGAEVSE